MPWGRQTQPNHEGFPYPLPARMAGARDAHAPVTASGTRPTSVPPGGSGPPTGSRGPTRYYGAGAHTGGTREGAFRPRAQEAAGQTTAQGRDPAAPGCRRPGPGTHRRGAAARGAGRHSRKHGRTHARTHAHAPSEAWPLRTTCLSAGLGRPAREVRGACVGRLHRHRQGCSGANGGARGPLPRGRFAAHT